MDTVCTVNVSIHSNYFNEVLHSNKKSLYKAEMPTSVHMLYFTIVSYKNIIRSSSKNCLPKAGFKRYEHEKHCIQWKHHCSSVCISFPTKSFGLSKLIHNFACSFKRLQITSVRDKTPWFLSENTDPGHLSFMKVGRTPRVMVPELDPARRAQTLFRMPLLHLIPRFLFLGTLHLIVLIVMSSYSDEAFICLFVDTSRFQS